MARKKTSPKRRAKATRGGSRKRRVSRRKRSAAFNLNLPQKALMAGIVLIFFAIIITLSLLSPNQGVLTAAVSAWMWRLFGWGGVVAPLAMGVGGFYLVLWGMGQSPRLPGYRLLGGLLLFLTFETFATLAVLVGDNALFDVWSIAQAGMGGGYLGGALVWSLAQLAGLLGTLLIFLVLGFIGVVLLSGISRQDIGRFLQAAWEAQQKRRQERARQTPAREIPIRSSSPARRVPEQPPVREEPARPAPSEEDGPAIRRAGRRQPASAPAAADSRPSPAPVFIDDSAANPQHQWKLPVLAQMLEAGGEQEINDVTIREQVEIIEETLDSFGAPATVVEISQGPTIIQYGVEPNFIEQRSGKRTKVKVGKIASLADDLALALAARSIRIQAPVPGKGYVGIEVPTTSKAMVSLRDVMESEEFQRIQSPLRIGLGQNVAGQPVAADLAAMPHLLIAGTTGSGKSVCVNGIIAGLLLQNTPEDLRIVMVDPKRVELTGYNGIPHLVAPVVVDLERVVGTLQWAMREMDNRYQRFSALGARNIVDYNQKALAKQEEKLPYIVIIVDELADLMMMSPEDTERGITRLAQMARATGIHMVIATQRPSVDVVTGLIKANFPARIAFAVASGTDSRVILDTTGAERLLGQGDMLFQSPDAAAPVRLQGCFVSDRELGNLIGYWQTARRQSLVRAKAEGDEETIEKVTQQPLLEELRAQEEEAAQAAQYEDELLPDAIEMVRKLNRASTSLLQRRFRIGYTRAARLIDAMEEQGIIGPPTGTSKAREVLPAGEEPAGPAQENEAES